ncbi:MAG: glutaminyl-peptide cyclotransferase [Verrucomicrobiales bacterium]|nr:glutaminyl-peptide cyclotransferase [Verrucomicrobiales bacterium]
MASGTSPAIIAAGRLALAVMAGSVAGADTTNAPSRGPEILRQYTYDVIHVWPHDREAFTQGLVYLDGQFLESTGLYGSSSLRRVELQTGKVLQRVDVPARYFAEGLAVLRGRAYQLTWQGGNGFVYSAATLQFERGFSYPGEGWGLTTDGSELILSDGTAQLRFLDPGTFEERRRVTVRAAGRLVDRLNELEYVKGEVWANVWLSDRVVTLDPATGRVTGVVDFTGLLPSTDRTGAEDVLNGIAYDAVGDRLWVTGKRWPKLFEVRLKAK